MIEVDEHEPLEIVRWLDVATEIEQTDLNAQGWADYRYTGEECFCHGASTYNTERKTWSDLGGGIEAVEAQLLNQFQSHPEVHHRLIVEGVVEPAPKGLIYYTKSPGQNMFRSSLRGERTQAMKSIRAWLHQVGKYCEVVFTFGYTDTAITLASYYEADQVPEDEHTTFKRMFKTSTFRANPQAEAILGASPKGFGPSRAEAVAKHFGLAWKAFKAPVEEWVRIPGVGEITARQYLRHIGRTDV